MKRLVGLLILAVALFCGQSNGILDCGPTKFPLLNPDSKPDFRKTESYNLSGIFCQRLIGNTGERNQLMSCVFSHRSYFEAVDVDSDTIKKYADFCSRYNIKGSCYNAHESSILLSRLMYYCWSMNDIAESNKNVFNKDLQITPDDWKHLYDVESINLPLCFDQISSENHDEKGLRTVVGSVSNAKFKNLELLKEYKKSLNNRKSYCNCVEILGLNVIFDTYNSKKLMKPDPSEKLKFIENVCIKTNKKHFWKKEQLQAISDFVSDLKNTMKYQISLDKLASFISEADNLANNRWYSYEPNYYNSKWPLSFIFDTSLIDAYTNFGRPMVGLVYDKNNPKSTSAVSVFDKLKFDVMAKAIFHGFSTDHFNEFVSLTSGLSLPLFTYPFNKWECKKLILDTFFDYNRSKNLPCIKYENFQYNVATVKHVNEHLSLFKQLVPQQTRCDGFSYEIKAVLDEYYTYWSKLDRAHLTTLLKSAVNNQQNIRTFVYCLRFSSFIEKQILEKQLFKYSKSPSVVEANDIISFETKMFSELRKRIFATKEIYGLCEKGKPDMKTLVAVLEKLYNEYLTDLFNLPDDILVQDTTIIIPIK